jgi:hypothetical protein
MTSAVAALRAFTRTSATRRSVVERCELCATPLSSEHPHLFEAGSRRLACACPACAGCFDRERDGKRWARVVPRVERLDGALDGPTWESLGVPVRLAYFTLSSAAGEPLALLPSPAGPIESPLPTEGWARLEARVSVTSALAPDVEGILAFDAGGNTGRAYRLSIDHAYRAIGHLRAHARGATAADLVRMLEDEVIRAIEREAR